jgi:3-oxoacyl-[acyl-carrier-protein] synthase III
LLAGRKFSRTLLLASEVENNSTTWPDNLLGIRETASGMTLEESAGEEGFTAFAFRWFPEEAEAIVSYTVAHDGQPALSHRRDPGLDRRLLDCIRTTVTMFLDREGLRLDDVALVIGPQRSTEFSSSLAEELSLPAGRLLVLDGEADYFTSSLAYSFARARRGRLTPGTVVLIIEAAAGLQVGCALYRI